nr:reverse transcriptase domain-containing protein [Tanacetum cinerariifolium]
MAGIIDMATQYVSDTVASMAKPEATVTDVDLKGVSLSEVTYVAKVNVSNPYSTPIPIGEIRYVLKSYGSVIASGTIPDPGSIKGSSDTMLDVEIKVPHTSVIASGTIPDPGSLKGSGDTMLDVKIKVPHRREKRRETRMLHLELTSRISVKNTMRTSCQSLWTRFAVTSEKKSMLDLISRKVPWKEDKRRFSLLECQNPVRESAFDRLSKTYSPSATKSKPDRRTPWIVLAIGVALTDGTLLMDIVLRVENAPMTSRNHMTTPIPPMGPTTDIAIATETAPSKSKRHKPMDEDDLKMPWMCEEVDPFTPRIRNFKSSRKTQMPNNVKTYDGTEDLEDHVKNFQVAAQQKKYVKDPVEIHNIKQKDRETIEDLMERFKVKTERMKGAPECMWISRFMHGLNNPELTKRLNEHVPKTMKKMMITTAAFIRGEAVAASKKKCHTSWRTQDQSKRHTSEKREITFPSLATNSGTEGPLVIEEKIGGHMIHRMYVDGGSSREVLYEHCFNRLWPKVKNQMVPATTSLTGFSGETIWSLGQLTLLVTIGDADHSTKAWMNFMIVRLLSPYNGFTGRPVIKEIQAVPSTAHGMLKFSAEGGIVTIRSTILIPAECAMELEIGGTLFAKGRTELCSLLKENMDIFAWQPSDMTGVPRSVVEHRLNIREGYSPSSHGKKARRQLANVRRFHGFKQGLSAGLLPHPEIDWKVESLCGYPFKCFLEAYKGHHQIQLAESDEEKTAFHIGQWVYCYTKMSFGLKNVGATYQRLVYKAFDSQIGQNIKVYVDELVIKSHTEAEMLRDIGKTFRMLRKINMKLNLKKYTFGEVDVIFLGYMITPEGIKSCPDKTEVVLQLPSPRTIKEKCNKKSDFHWTSKAEQAFKQLKQHLSELSLVVAPKPKEELIVYLSASYGAISAVLMTERGMVQTSVYFVSRALQGPKLNYTPMEKLVLSLVFAAKRLRRTSVTGQVLADFLAEMPDESPPDASVVETQQEPWTIFTNRSSCLDGSSVGLILTSPKGTQFTYALRFQFAASNNEAEYEALIAGLQIAAQMGVKNVH